MTKQEFNSLTGISVTDKYFKVINKIYRLNLFGKKEFCRAYIKESKNLGFNACFNAVAELMQSVGQTTDGKTKREIELSRRLIDISSGATGLTDEDVQLIGKEEYIKYKIDAGYAISNRDILIIRKLLNENTPVTVYNNHL